MGYRVVTEMFDFGYEVGLAIFETDREGMREAVAQEIIWKSVDPNSPLEDDFRGTFRLSKDAMDALLGAFAEEAWKRGLRPKDSNDNHLADMRRLVFDELMPVVKAKVAE